MQSDKKIVEDWLKVGDEDKTMILVGMVMSVSECLTRPCETKPDMTPSQQYINSIAPSVAHVESAVSVFKTLGDVEGEVFPEMVYALRKDEPDIVEPSAVILKSVNIALDFYINAICTMYGNLRTPMRSALATVRTKCLDRNTVSEVENAIEAYEVKVRDMFTQSNIISTVVKDLPDGAAIFDCETVKHFADLAGEAQCLNLDALKLVQSVMPEQ